MQSVREEGHVQNELQGLSGGPGVGASPSDAGSAGLTSGWGLRSHVPCGREIDQKQYCDKVSKRL